MKAVGLAIAFLFLGLGTLSAAPLDEREEARVKGLQNEFQTGKIGFCTLLWFKDNSTWMVEDDPQSDHVRLIRMDLGHDPASKNLYFNDRDAIAQIMKVDRQTMKCAN